MSDFPEIPRTWLVAGLMIAAVVMRAFSIDSWTTAVLSLVAGYIVGKHIEQTTETKYILPPDSDNDSST